MADLRTCMCGIVCHIHAFGRLTLQTEWVYSNFTDHHLTLSFLGTCHDRPPQPWHWGQELWSGQITCLWRIGPAGWYFHLVGVCNGSYILLRLDSPTPLFYLVCALCADCRPESLCWPVVSQTPGCMEPYRMNQPLYVEVLSLVECHSYNCHIVVYAACVDRVVSFRSLKTLCSAILYVGCMQCHVICRLLEGCPRLGGFWFRKAILVLEGCSNLGGLSSVPYALPSRMSTGFSSLDDHCLTS